LPTSDELIAKLEYELPRMQPRPKLLILNFPANPTTQCVELSFFERLVPLCRELGIYMVHDLAYADLVFDGYRAPSIAGGAGGEGDCGRVLYALEELQHAGLAGGLYGGQQAAGGGAGADQELLRLRDVYSDTGGFHRGAGGAAGVCSGNCCKL
jgi:hypothetical protein